MIILGIDPGFSRLGYAIIETDKDNSKVIDCSCFKTSPQLEYGIFYQNTNYNWPEPVPVFGLLKKNQNAWQPKHTLEISKDDQEKLKRLFEEIDDIEDIQDITTNCLVESP